MAKCLITIQNKLSWTHTTLPRLDSSQQFAFLVFAVYNEHHEKDNSWIFSRFGIGVYVDRLWR
jgi:hypothetical protein